MKAVVDEALEKYGRLDILFANAAIVGTNQLFWDIEAEDFIKTLRTNVLRYVHTYRFPHFLDDQPSEKSRASDNPPVQCFSSD